MMKRLAGVFAVVVFLFVSVAQAEEGEKKPAAGYGGGFFLQSDDGAFKLKITGGIKPRFQFSDSTTTDPVLTFSLRSANINFSAVIKEKTTFNIGLSHATNSRNFDSVNVSGITLEQSIIPQFNIAVGMVGLPLDLGGSGGFLTEPPITYTQADGSEPFAVTRESFGAPGGLGLRLSGDIGKFSYTWAVVNGAESDYQINADKKFSTGANVVFNILEPTSAGPDFGYSEKPGLSVGVGGTYQGKRTDTAFAEARDDAMGLAAGTSVAPEITRMLQFSTGAGFNWKGLSIQSDGYWRLTNFSAFGDLPLELQDSNLTDFAYNAAVGYFIIPKKLEAALLASQVFREGPDNNGNQLGAGMTYYLKGSNLKMQLTYVWAEDYDDIDGTKNKKSHRAVVQMQAKF